MIKHFILSFVCCVLAQTAWADSELTEAQSAERLSLVTNINHGVGLTYRAAVIQRMLAEANWAAARLKLPTKRPIQVTDVQDDYICAPWFSVLHGTNRFPDTIFGSHIFDPDIPREQRVRALKIGLYGRIDTMNFEFGFDQGRLLHVQRLSEPTVEYYARNLDDLIGKTSLIDTNGAYQLATQWLAAVDVDMAALSKLKWTVNQLHYLARGATNAVTLPLYYVDFGTKHYPASGNLHAFDEPLVSVKILGTTKELIELHILDNSFCRRSPLLVTNALDLIRTPNPSVKQLQNPITARAYALTPEQVSNYGASHLQLTNSSPSVQTNSDSP